MARGPGPNAGDGHRRSTGHRCEAAATDAMRRRVRAVLALSGRRGRAGRRRPDRSRLQRRERVLRRDAVRGVRHRLGPARERWRPAGRDVVCRRDRRAADAVRALPAAAVGARRAADVCRREHRPAAHERAAAVRVRCARSWPIGSDRRTDANAVPAERHGRTGPASARHDRARHGLRASGHVAGHRVWTAYWDGATGAEVDSERGQGSILDEAPTRTAAADVIAWGLARTRRVIVVDADGELFWAGEGPPPAEVPRRWNLATVDQS